MRLNIQYFKIRFYMNVYNGIMLILNYGICVVSKYYKSTVPKSPQASKTKTFIAGQQGLLQRIANDMRRNKDVPTYWFHAASLGEYAVARPIIAAIKQKQECVIVMTFFSPTGYEALKKVHANIDYLYYLPLDTLANARCFIKAVRPDKAIFIISEYWCNYLFELQRQHIPTYLISAMIRRDAVFFKWYGSLYRKALTAFTHFMVADDSSKRHLNILGFDNITITGDPLFDNAIAISKKEWSNSIIERFARQGDIFIAGSISDEKDLALVSSLANRYRDIHFIFVPHEISEECSQRIKYKLRGYALCYSECDESTDFSQTQVLIIDFLGALAYIYRYAKWAYVGGGFTPYLHSIIEATVYGLPVSFGPKINRKVTPQQMMELGIGQIVKNSSELEQWFAKLRHNTSGLQHIKLTAANYVESNAGATEKIVNEIIKG